MKNNKKIINSAKKTLASELSSIKNIKSTFNSNFCKAVNLIYNTKGKIVLIGVGGITSGRDAFEKISYGCSLLQLYTSLVYKGPNVVIHILSELSSLLKQKGIKKIGDLVGKNINL